MTRSKRMAPLQNLAAKRQDEAALQLASSTRDLQEQEQRYGLLSKYRDEYALRPASAATLVNPMLLANREAFRQRLDEAVEEQAGIVEHNRQVCEVERAQLIEASRKATVIDNLTASYKAQEARVEAGREQRVLDDLGARRGTGNQGGFSK